jgi:MFS superfamily sulfate permease-like transporter
VKSVIAILKSRFLIADFVAGLSVAFILLPEAVAYAAIAHLPIQAAITGTIVGLISYAWFGGSAFAVVAPTSSEAALMTQCFLHDIERMAAINQ